MTDVLLVLNAGSSSLKFAVYGHSAELPLLLKGSASRISHGPLLRIQIPGEPDDTRALGAEPISLVSAAKEVFAELGTRGLTERVAVVGHRIVHGGLAFVNPTILHAQARHDLRRLTPLAPLHQPYNLEIVGLASDLMPDAIQVGCFDTAFHADRPRQDRLYALPRHFADEGIVAYGFHGLSYQHIAAVLRRRYGANAGGRTIAAHLGSGASLCAMNAGASVATTMGFSALDGIIMSSRCGSIDPGVVLHLLRERAMSADAVSDLLHQRSGLLGVSGISGDMAMLLDNADPRAAEAIDLFVYRIGRAIGSLAAALGGIDRLVFTAGIGENAPLIRQRIGDATEWLGVRIDPVRNESGDAEIAAAGAAVAVDIIRTDEERAVAEGALACMGSRSGEARKNG